MFDSTNCKNPSAGSGAGEDRSQLAVIITANPIPSHPDPTMMMTTLASIRALKLPTNSRIHLVHDAPRPGTSPNEAARFAEYLDRLIALTDGDAFVQIHRLREWSHLAGVMRYITPLIEEPYLLVCQHDFPFTTQIDLPALLSAMDKDHRIQMVRFNQRANLPAGTDANPHSRAEFFREASIASDSVRLMQTLSWSSNNHLARLTYYQQRILPLTGNERTFMERIVNPLVTAKTHSWFGTYVYGAPGDSPAIGHLDGRTTGSLTAGRPRPAIEVRLFNKIKRPIYRVRLWRTRKNSPPGA